MHNLIALVAAGVALIQLPSSIPRMTRSDPVLVRAVIDGDTIDVERFGRVRLLGIDAPEMARGFDTTAPFAREARDKLISLVLRHFVRLENDQRGDARDTYNRQLAYVVREDGLVVNTEIVREGLARVTARAPLVRLDELKRAEAQAQSLRRGIWGSTPRIPSPRYTRPSP